MELILKWVSNIYIDLKFPYLNLKCGCAIGPCYSCPVLALSLFNIIQMISKAKTKI